MKKLLLSLSFMLCFTMSSNMFACIAPGQSCDGWDTGTCCNANGQPYGCTSINPFGGYTCKPA